MRAAVKKPVTDLVSVICRRGKDLDIESRKAHRAPEDLEKAHVHGWRIVARPLGELRSTGRSRMGTRLARGRQVDERSVCPASLR